jgi:DNA-binding response OmpR family regulator
MEILIVENDHLLHGEMHASFSTEGYTCQIFQSPVAALSAVTSYYYDIIIFNLSTLNQEEINFLRWVKSAKHSNKTILTYQQNDMVRPHKVAALEMEHLQKPYSLTTLHLLIQSMTTYEKQDGRTTLYCKELMVDVPGRTVKVKDQVVPLTRLEFDLLHYFVSNKSQVLPKQQIVLHITKANKAESSDYGFLYAHIKNLKKKLKSAGCGDYIETVYGIGYRFQS